MSILPFSICRRSRCTSTYDHMGWKLSPLAAPRSSHMCLSQYFGILAAHFARLLFSRPVLSRSREPGSLNSIHSRTERPLELSTKASRLSCWFHFHLVFHRECCRTSDRSWWLNRSICRQRILQVSKSYTLHGTEFQPCSWTTCCISHKRLPSCWKHTRPRQSCDLWYHRNQIEEQHWPPPRISCAQPYFSIARDDLACYPWSPLQSTLPWDPVLSCLEPIMVLFQHPCDYKRKLL